MLSKLATFKLIATSSFLFLSLLLFSFSCEDHPEPPRIFPVINTLDIVRVNDDPSFKYQVQFSELGNQGIIEYGVVTYAGSANENVVPTIPVVDQLKGRKYDFSGPNYMPANLSVKGLTKSYDGPTGQIRLFYRAYAITSTNQVVYGQVKFADFFKQGVELTDPEFGDCSVLIQSGTAFISYSFTSIGTKVVSEYGLVYVWDNNYSNNIYPTTSAKKMIITKPLVAGTFTTQTGTPQVEAPDFETKNQAFHYRPYALLDDGTVVYGNVKSLF